MSSYTEHAEKRTASEQLRMDNFANDTTAAEWSPENSPRIPPRPIIVCNRCRRPFDSERDVARDWFDTTRCPSCGEQHSKREVLCDRTQINTLESDSRASNGLVYVLRAENGDVKIGVTKNLDNRIKTINTGTPLVVEVVEYFEVANPYQMESEIHQKLSDWRKKGEWFTLDDRTLDEFLPAVKMVASNYTGA